MKVCSICRRCCEDEIFSCTDESHPSPHETRAGSPEMVDGYRLETLLRSGVKGESYRGRHIASDCSCLVRILPACAPNHQQFLHDAALASGLIHPGVADIY